MFLALPARRVSGDWFLRSHLFTAALWIFIVATRWPLAPKYLYSFDSANFALALEKFNPALHQPQPPGYPLFVALTRAIHFWVGPPQQVFLIAGLLAACATTFLIRVLATDLFGRAAGIFSAALMASNPVFWFGGITNQVRVFLALGAVGVALLAWRALTRPAQPAWFYATFAGLGVAAGFRPDLAIMLLPLLLWTWHRTGPSIRRLVFGLGLLLATTLPWVSVIVWTVGGPMHVMEMLWSYCAVQFGDSSAFFGATPSGAYKMFISALVWHLLAAAVWIWAVPAMVRRRKDSSWHNKAAFLALGIFPPLLFSAFVHISDPDQALAGISMLCLAGGGVLAGVAGRLGSRNMLLACGAILTAQTLIFFYPPGRIARASSYRAAAAVNRMNTNALTAIRALRRDGPITIVDYGSSVASRHLVYYFPEEYVVVLPGSPVNPLPAEATQLFYRHEALQVPAGAAGLIRRASRKVVCLLPWNAKPGDLPGATQYGTVYYFKRSAGTSLRLGPFWLLPESSLRPGS